MKHRRLPMRRYKARQCLCWMCRANDRGDDAMFRKFKLRRDALKGWDR